MELVAGVAKAVALQPPATVAVLPHPGKCVVDDVESLVAARGVLYLELPEGLFLLVARDPVVVVEVVAIHSRVPFADEEEDQ